MTEAAVEGGTAGEGEGCAEAGGVGGMEVQEAQEVQPEVHNDLQDVGQHPQDAGQ